MNDIKKLKVYFASPWFNPEQAEREERIKNRLRELGFNVWSPKENSSLSPITDSNIRKRVFAINVNNIKDSDIIFPTLFSGWYRDWETDRKSVV